MVPVTVVGRATVEISPDASGFGPKTEAAIKKALAGVAAKIDLHLDESGLRSKIAAAVAKAGAGANIKIGTDLDVSPLRGKVRQAIEDATSAAAEAGERQLDLFDVDPSELVAEVEAAKAAAQAALSSGRQLELELDFDFEDKIQKALAALDAATGQDINFGEAEIPLEVDDDGLRADVSAAVKKAEVGQKIKVPVDVDSGGGGAGGSADRVGAAAGGIFGRAVLRSAGRVLAAGGLAQLFTAATSGAVAIGSALTAATGAGGSLVSTVSVLPGILSAAAQAAASIGFALGGVGSALKAYSAQQKAIGVAAAGGGGGGDGGASARAAERAIRDATRGIADAEREAAEAVEAANERMEDSLRGLADARESLEDTYVDSAERIQEANDRIQESIEGVAEAERDLEGVVERSAERIAAAQDRIAESVRNVTEAREAQEETAERNARRVEDAERGLARSHRNVQDAQERLSRARREAVEDVEDLRRSVARLALTEDQARARLDVARKKAALEQQRNQQDLTGVTEETLAALERQRAIEDRAVENPREQALLDLRDAELDLEEATERRGETQAQLNKAELSESQKVIDARENLVRAEEGLQESIRTSAQVQRDTTRDMVEAHERVERSERALQEAHRDSARVQRDTARDIAAAQQQVIDAQEKVQEAYKDSARVQRDASRDIEDAQERVNEALRDSQRAQRDVIRAQEDGARRIADAHENLADAVARAGEVAAGGTSGAAGAIDRYQAALDALSPAARRFVEFLVSLDPLLKRIQATAAAGLFPGLETAIRTVLPLVDDLEPILFDTAQALANLAIEGANLIASPAFRGDLITIGRRNIDLINTLGRAAIAGGDALRHITIAAGPLTQRLANLVGHYAEVIRQQAEMGRDSGRMEAFFERVGDRIDRLLVTLQFLGTSLFRVFRDATPAGDAYFDKLLRLSAQLDIITQKASADGSLRAFFENAMPAVDEVFRLVRDLGVGLFKLGTDNMAAFTAFTEQLRTQLLPVLLEVLGKIDTDFLSALVSLTTAAANLFGAVLTGNPTLTLMVNTLADLADVVSTLLTDIPILSPILQGVVTILGGLAVVGAVTALKDFASTAFGVKKALMDITGAANEAELAKTRLGATAARVGTVLSRAFIGAALVIAYRQALETLSFTMDDVVESTRKSQDPLRAFEEGIKRLANPSLYDRILKGLKEITQFNFADPIQAFKAIQKAMEDTGSKGKETFTLLARESAATAARVIADAKAQGKNTEDYERILESLIQEKARHGLAEEEVSKKIADATNALKGNNTELQRHIDTMRRATDQALSLSGAELGTEEAVDRLTDSLVRNGLTFDTNTEKGRENKRALDSLVGSIQAEITELGKAAQTGQLDNDRKRRLLDHLYELERSGYPGAKDAAARLRLELESVERTYTGYVDLDTSRAQAKIASLQRQLNAIEAQTVAGEEAGARTSAGVQREFGGRVLRNSAYIVGEKRPELFIPDQDGVIFPHVPDMADPQLFGPTNLPPNTSLLPSGTSFDMEGLLRSLREAEEELTEQLRAQGEMFRSEAPPAGEPATGGVTVEQTINGPLIKIEQTFGPGSSANDIIAAMEAIADKKLADALARVLADHAAGAGTRST